MTDQARPPTFTRPALAVGQWVRHVHLHEHPTARVEAFREHGLVDVRRADGVSARYSRSWLIPIAPPAGGAS